MSTLSYSKNEMRADIRRVARLLNHSPSSVEYMRLGRYNIRSLSRKFNLPWKQIIESLGLRYTLRTSRRIPATQELRDDIMRVAREVNHPPTRAEYQSRGKFGAETVRRRSCEKKWEDAVAALTGLGREEVKRHQQRGGCYRTTQEWLFKLHELSQKLGHAPTTWESNEAGINAHQLRLRVGGNWIDVLKAAGIDIRSRSTYATLRSTTTEALIEDVVNVSHQLNRPPTRREYEAVGHYCYHALSRILGGWLQVKKIVTEMLQDGKFHDRFMVLPDIRKSYSTMSSVESIQAFFGQTARNNNVQRG